MGIDDHLAEGRERIGLNQTEFAAKAGVLKAVSTTTKRVGAVLVWLIWLPLMR